MRRIILFIPTFILSIFVFSQKKNDNIGLAKSDVILKTNMQKNLETLNKQDLTNNFLGKAEYIAEKYKSFQLNPLLDSSGFLQPFKVDLGKEIKPTCSLKINGIQLQPNIDYWPFSFCPNSLFSGTAVWNEIETKQPFLYDLKPELEKNKKKSPADLVQHIKMKAAELAGQKASAVIVYNSSDIDDSLTFFAKDTAEPASIPIIYFTKNGIRKLKEESTIANAIDAQIVLGEKIATGTNAIAFLNNDAANTIVIATAMNNNMGNTLIFELAKILKEICRPAKTNTTGFIPANYTNNNYLFANFSGFPPDNVGSNYFFNHLPFNVSKINYAINIGVSGAPTDTIGFLSIIETNSSTAWKEVLQKSNPSYISKTNSTLIYMLNSTPFYKNNIPNLFLFNPNFDTEQKSAAITVNNNDIKTIQYILQLIGNTNNNGKLPFNKNAE